MQVERKKMVVHSGCWLFDLVASHTYVRTLFLARVRGTKMLRISNTAMMKGDEHNDIIRYNRRGYSMGKRARLAGNAERVILWMNADAIYTMRCGLEHECGAMTP